MQSCALVIMSKAPDPERVKTRLKPFMSDTERMALYIELLEGTVARLRDVPGMDTFISFAPECGGEYFERFDLPLFAQEGQDLGKRMHNDLVHVLGMGYKKAAVVGADIPGLEARTVREAFDQLEEKDCVFGPSSDGGYYLLAVSRPEPGLFEDVPWSSPMTLELSLERAREFGLRAGLVETLHDIDTIDDVRRYRNG